MHAIFKLIFLYKNSCILIQISYMFAGDQLTLYVLNFLEET